MAKATFSPSDLMESQIFGFPVDRGILLSNHKNVYKKRIEKRQRKLIVKLAFLKPFLKKGEKILLMTTGYSPLASPAQYLTGFLFVYLKRAMYIFTNYRIFHAPVTSTIKYKNSIAQIDYAGCQSIMLKGGTLVVKYAKAGKSEKFKAVAVSERKKIKALLKNTIQLSGTRRHSASRIHLCPNCTHKLEDGKYTCESCNLKFKSKRFAALSSIFIPGGGYFYIRHYLLGSLNAVLEIFLLFYSAFLISNSINHIPVNLIHLVAAPLIFLYLKMAALVHSTHFIDEFIPQEKNIKPR
jgi:predicted amidophosphoribosyltransferase